MSKLDVTKKQIGWLKIIFGSLVAANLSVLAWLLQNFDTVVWYKTLFAGAVFAALSFFTFKINQKRNAPLKDWKNYERYCFFFAGSVFFILMYALYRSAMDQE